MTTRKVKRIIARRTLNQPPERVFEFLADLHNHWRLNTRFVDLDRIRADGGLVRIRGPLGVSRVARTRVLEVEPPAAGAGRLRGRADVGSRTVGSIRWDIVPAAGGRTEVTLAARVVEASPLDRMLLAAGGRRWLARIFEDALENLGHVLAGSSRTAGGSDWVSTGLVAGAVAAVVSGAPSTAHALVTGRDPLEATLAAGSILLPRTSERGRLVLAAVPVHVAISLGWGLVLSLALPRRRPLPLGAVAGLAIAALDLGTVGRLFPRIRRLPLGPQVADHVAYGIAAAAVIAHLRRRE